MLSKRLRGLRLKRGFTQQNMANQLSVSLNAYQKYEQGERFPPLETLVKICDILQAPTDYLLGREEYLKSLGVSVDEFQ